MDNTGKVSVARRQKLEAVWPWLLLGAWLMVSAAQIWALEVETVQRGDACTASPVSLWTGAAP
ncbi:MAG: hypothetical protein PHW25_12625 [Zoogloea sp.]|uniref:hypothetical protein n=1 Tax=Zoogloea sp. TaxID=49181 RepID=UPI00261C4A35|nr:hypothetical protein [Zoogloea sp.]MDD3327916.1 hypothetical protein [Zoogloea sp.]